MDQEKNNKLKCLINDKNRIYTSYVFHIVPDNIYRKISI